MPKMKALALTVWDKKIFKVFSFGCNGNHSSSWNSYLWSILKVHHPRIISVKFHWNLLAGFRGEDFLSNCSRTDTGQWSITIAHPEHVVLRWAKNSVKKGESAVHQHFPLFQSLRLRIVGFVVDLLPNNHREEAFWKHCGKRRKCW